MCAWVARVLRNTPFLLLSAFGSARRAFAYLYLRRPGVPEHGLPVANGTRPPTEFAGTSQDELLRKLGGAP